MVDDNFFDYLSFIRIDLNLYKSLTMFIKGNCAMYIAKNLKVFENNTGIFVLWRVQLSYGSPAIFIQINKTSLETLPLSDIKKKTYVTSGNRTRFLLRGNPVF